MSSPAVAPYGQGSYGEVNGLRMYYEDHGQGTPLILLHGGPATSEMWQDYLPLLAPHYRVLTPDSRAQGRTNNPAGTLSYALMADDIAALIRHLGLASPLIMGFSDGAQVGLELALRHPGLTGPLVLLSVWHRFTTAYADQLRAGGIAGPGQVDYQQIERDSPGWVQMMRADHISSADPDYWRELLRQCSHLWWTPLHYSPAKLARITAPVLVALGDRDGMIDLEQAVELYRLIPGAELLVLPDTGHASPNIALLTGLVRDFYQRRGGQRDGLN